MLTDADDFPFDQWASLAAADPQGFETARRRVLQSLIESAPAANRRRLEGLQWQIDRACERADSPLAACIKISSMMWDTVLGENGLVDSIEQLNGTKPLRERRNRNATVLTFARREDGT